MCTVTIGHKDGALVVTMNRDERKERNLEKPPSVIKEREMEVAYPVDVLSGGTWFGVNDRKEVLCLLNRYDDVDYSPNASRGSLIPSLLVRQNTTIDEALRTFIESKRAAPFTLVAVGGEKIMRYDWNGDALDANNITSDAWQHVSSSSFRASEALPYRAEQFEIWLNNDMPYDGDVPSYHRQRAKGNEELSVWTTRPHSETKSISQVEIADDGSIVMRYWAYDDVLKQEPTKQVSLKAA